MPAKSRGFTLYELLITTILLALLAGIAIPSFADTLARQRQRAEIDALFHAVHLARKESIMRRKVVSLCPSIDGRMCAPSRDWSAGWLMFENKDRDSPPSVDPDEPVLLAHSTQQQLRITANRKGFTFRATFLRATNGTIVTPIIEPQGRTVPLRLIGPGEAQPQRRVEARVAPLRRTRLRHGLDQPPTTVLGTITGRFLTVRQTVVVVIKPIVTTALRAACPATVQVALSSPADSLWRRRPVTGLSASTRVIVTIPKTVAVVVHLVGAVGLGLGADTLRVVAVGRPISVVVATVGAISANLRDVVAATDDWRQWSSDQGLDRQEVGVVVHH